MHFDPFHYLSGNNTGFSCATFSSSLCPGASPWVDWSVSSTLITAGVYLSPSFLAELWHTTAPLQMSPSLWPLGILKPCCWNYLQVWYKTRGANASAGYRYILVHGIICTCLQKALNTFFFFFCIKQQYMYLKGELMAALTPITLWQIVCANNSSFCAILPPRIIKSLMGLIAGPFWDSCVGGVGDPITVLHAMKIFSSAPEWTGSHRSPFQCFTIASSSGAWISTFAFPSLLFVISLCSDSHRLPPISPQIGWQAIKWVVRGLADSNYKVCRNSRGDATPCTFDFFRQISPSFSCSAVNKFKGRQRKVKG